MRLLPAILLLILCAARPGAAAAQGPASPFVAPTPASRPATAPRAQASGVQPPGVQPITPAEAQRVLDMLRDDRRRAEFTATLEGLLRASALVAPAGAPVAGSTPSAGQPAAAPAGTAPPAASPPAAPAPASAAPASPTPAKPEAPLPLAPDSLASQLLLSMSGWASDVSGQLTRFGQTAYDLPRLLVWMQGVAADPDARGRATDAAVKLAIVAVVALGLEALAIRFLRHPREMLARHAPGGAGEDGIGAGAGGGPGAGAEAAGANAADAEGKEPSARRPSRRRAGLRSAWQALRRLPFVVGRLVLDLLPVAVFLVIGNAMLGTAVGRPLTTRLIILDCVQAYAVMRLVLCLFGMLVDPPHSRLRLLRVSDAAAIFVMTWARRIVALTVWGLALAEVASLLGLDAEAHDALLKAVALVVHLMLAVVVLRGRSTVAAWIRPAPDARGALATLRVWVASVWHWLALSYLAAEWLLYAVEVPNGFAKLLHLFVSGGVVLALARMVSLVALGALDRLVRGDNGAGAHPDGSGLRVRSEEWYPWVRRTVEGVLVAATGLVLLEVWGVDVASWFHRGRIGSAVLSAAVVVGITALIGLAVWEGVNAAIDRHMLQLDAQAQVVRSARLRTLLPLLRTALLATILTVVGLTALSEIGVNIAPLLAGAGVVGVAVGFGSQSLVKDLITGLFLLLENAMQVGDVVTAGGLSGTVEHLSIRTIRLRALDGSVHIIPFSSVTTVTNQTRDFSYAVLDVSIGLNEEPDRVFGVLQEIGAGMRADPDWAPLVIGELEVLGVERFLDAAWVLRARIKAQPASRWKVMREFNRRVKYRFDELAIHSPFTSPDVFSGAAPSAAAAPAPAIQQPAQETHA